MAKVEDSWFRKVLLLYLILLLYITSSFISAQTSRMLLELEDDDDVRSSSITNKKLSTPTKKNLTKTIKPSSKNQTKLTTKLPFDHTSKNTTKLIKIKSLNSTSTSKFKKLNSTSNSTKKSLDLAKNNKPQMAKTILDPKSTKNNKPQMEKTTLDPKSTKNNKDSKSQMEKTNLDTKPTKKPQKKQTQFNPEDNEDDFISNFRDLPTKFQESIVPDLERISKTSRGYLTTYNKEFTRGFKPYVGNKYAPTIASLVSLLFIIIPLILVTLIFSKIKAYFSFQKILIFIQIYLSIYFTILCLSSLATGLEPLKFFYSTSQSTYVCVQVLQTLAYVLYLLLLLMYLILVFSTETELSTKVLGLGQTFVGFAVGLHYYVTVFHRAVLHQPPKTSWKAHGLYATCFLVICLLGRVERRKKAYFEGDEEGKMN